MRHYVYILSNKKGLTYVGVTDWIPTRLRQHRYGENKFTAKYRITRLVYVEPHPDQASAARREKQIKGWRRSKKHALIESVNPGWSDLSEPFR